MPRKRKTSTVSKSYKESPFIGNIEKQTEQNTDYRRVLYTDGDLQLVLMSIPVHTEIGMEIHPHTTQFIRVESGRARVVLKSAVRKRSSFSSRGQRTHSRKSSLAHNQTTGSTQTVKSYDLGPGDVVVVPFNTYHNVINVSRSEPLQLYTIYAPAEHRPHTVEVSKPIIKNQ